ncbi:YfiR family protein [Massilia consociata]|uniref:YfiR family protein n=1 Tax=Massilia consociata TaxID=760117 RepID=A0ABV6FBI6_9BURK
MPRPFIRSIGFAAIGALACALAAAQVRDVELKAAYIYNFAQFTVWPETARPKASFIVCASPNSTLWTSLQSFNGKPVNGRAWSTVDVSGRLKEGDCDVLVLTRSAERPPALPGTLVVRDGAGRGAAAITLVDGDELIRFDVDTEEATRNGLRFSSKLLRLARNVI